MASASPNTLPTGDESSRPDTPSAPQETHTPIQTTPTDNINLHQTQDSESLVVTDQLSSPSRSEPSLPDLSNDALAWGPISISTEVDNVDISVAPDGSFVETPSGFAAREIKRHWDQQMGVGKSIRSPYAITAFVNQHGKSMFRVGRREMMSAPAASAAEVEERIIQSTSPSETSISPRTNRRSRMSMHAFLPPSMFRGTSTSSGRPPANIASASLPRKLRKTRSIPDLVSLSANESSSSTSTSSQHISNISALTGRAHSHSVTGADIAPFSTVARPPGRDLFGEIMDWSVSTNDELKSPSLVLHPFGHGVTYDSPSRKPALEYLPAPRLLREMQSFESGLTARQLDAPNRPGRDSPLASEEANRPPSALRVHTSPTEEAGPVIESEPNSDPLSLSETTAISRYSTDVFDVLQTYRGLPLLERISLDSEETTVIKMSLSSDDTAAPRDDPRFVIWGEIQAENDHDDRSVSHESADLSASPPTLSKRRNTRSKVPDAPSSSGEGTIKVIIAATIERWIAQLTSDLNYDELLDFFLTYRTYVSAIDLCHLLICRFHWALQPAISPRDERIRRIVRVRTFVATRYWLLTFFTVDFLPNRELRFLVANWLNTLIRDPILEKHNDGKSIVRKLMKVAKDCKQAHTRTPPATKPRATSALPKPAPGKQEHVLGAKFAEATQKPIVEEDDSDVDLNLDDESSTYSALSFTHDPANAHLNAAHLGAGLAPARPASMPFPSFSILQRTDHAPGPGMESDVTLIQTNTALPVHHNMISRAFVKTIGRLGRWKRVLNSRSVARASLGACADVSAFDPFEVTSGDLLSANGGVEHYLRMVPQPSAQSLTSAITLSPTLPPTKLPLEPPPSEDPRLLTPHTHTEATTEDNLQSETSEAPSAAELAESETDQEASILEEPDILGGKEQAISLRSSSTDSFGTPLGYGGPPPTFTPLAQPQWRFDVVSIDDLDFSDTSSDYHVTEPALPPGLRRPRRLPLRREFEFVRRSDSVSSMGLASHDSMTSQASRAMSTSSVPGFGGGITKWQMNALADSWSNDDEGGDVEEALRRLEGQINPQEQREKALKVDGWVRTMQERMMTGDYHNEELRVSDDEDFIDYLAHDDSASQHNIPAPSDGNYVGDGASELLNTPVPTQLTHVIPPPPLGPGSPTRTEAKPAPEDAVPIEILQSRVSSRPSTASSQKPPVSFTTPDPPRLHRSFILNHRASDLAQHFAMIDREIFMGVKFEELVSDDGINSAEIDVLDWAQYLKDRTRWKAEKRFPGKTTALAAVRARFNLMANFTISEIILTQPSERPVLVAKFIRIAWKAYSMANFGTLVAIIAALQSEWVTRAMKKSAWSRVGIWENRMFKDLKIFTTNIEDFKYIRQVVASIVDSKPLDASTQAASVVSGGTDTHSGKGKVTTERPTIPSACIPFIGVYLSQLQRHSKLPDLIDPTAPNEAVGMNPITTNLDAPAHPEVFSTLAPLPPSMHLEPLINVHKQRRIAGVIKALVAGQHLASRVQFEIDKKLFQKCLRLRGLDQDMLRRALAVHGD